HIAEAVAYNNKTTSSQCPTDHGTRSWRRLVRASALTKTIANKTRSGPIELGNPISCQFPAKVEVSKAPDAAIESGTSHARKRIPAAAHSSRTRPRLVAPPGPVE